MQINSSWTPAISNIGLLSPKDDWVLSFLIVSSCRLLTFKKWDRRGNHRALNKFSFWGETTSKIKPVSEMSKSNLLSVKNIADEWKFIIYRKVLQRNKKKLNGMNLCVRK